MVSIDYLLNLIREDAPFGDVTSETIIPDIGCNARISAEQPAVIAGLSEASALFRYFEVGVDELIPDGSLVRRGDTLMTLHGPAKKILLVERTALNIIGRMSGIATTTREFAELVHRVNSSCRVAATRKTCPGFRELDKKAVSLGGGDTHRSNLSDGILIKDNHLAIVSLDEAIALAQSRSRCYKIEVEVETREDAVRAAQSGSDIIMFDNMTPRQVQDSLDALTQKGLRDNVIVEISGGIDVSTIVEYAALDVDVISIGALTHSVKNIPVHLEIMPLKK
ncbi:MAG: carboxylating nicotinate-nucleotide diphosphorylase [Methanoregula sp.]|nr:MAG: carboxylating nicotinate-nucleotide diphosphorylase [Methanoregula sp.]